MTSEQNARDDRRSQTDAAAASSPVVTDAIGRQLRLTDDPLTTAPLHPWEGDDEGHNCSGCPDGGTWRCDRQAHPEHYPVCFTLDPTPVYDDGTPNPCDCRIWRMFDPMGVQRIVKQRMRAQLEAHARSRALVTPSHRSLP